MPWTTATGQHLEYPFSLHAKIARDIRPKREEVLDVLEKAQAIHDAAMRMDARIRELEADNLRLMHENAFMLSLLNEREA